MIYSETFADRDDFLDGLSLDQDAGDLAFTAFQDLLLAVSIDAGLAVGLVRIAKLPR